MKDQKKTELRVGVTVIIGIIIFIWILGWAKNFSLSTTNKSVVVKFNNASGLEVGDVVTVNGVRKGSVEDIKIDRQNVLVKLNVDNDVRLKDDSKFAISMLDLMGGKKIDIYPGTSGKDLNFNEVQQGVFYADIPQAMSLVGDLRDKITVSLDDVNLTLKSLNNYLTDENIQKNVKGSLANLNTLTSKINIMIDENRNSIKALTANTVELTEEAKNFIKENKTNVKNSIEDLNSVLKKTDSLLSKTNSLVDETKNKENNLGKLLYDENVYKNLNESLIQLNELSKLILKQLKEDGFKVDANIF